MGGGGSATGTGAAAENDKGAEPKVSEFIFLFTTGIRYGHIEDMTSHFILFYRDVRGTFPRTCAFAFGVKVGV